jgi:hypothetical protein
MKVQFLQDVKTAKIPDFEGQKLCLFWEGIEPPGFAGFEYMDMQEYRKKYTKIEPSLIVLVGLNRIINPANRCDFVLDHLSTLTPNIPKMSIDTAPFIGEPWRLFYHYQFTKTGRFLHPHSYALETEWKSWFCRDREDSIFQPEILQGLLADTYSDLPLRKTAVTWYEVESEWYENIKTHAFSMFPTYKNLLNFLIKEANSKYAVSVSYNDFGKPWHLPDLGIYRFLVEEMLRREAIWNTAVTWGQE